jgi:hypothetical protein
MEKSELRREVLRVLREESQTHVHAIESQLRQTCEEYGRGDALRMQEVIWELLLQGVLAPGKNSLNLHLPFLHLTEYGARCLEDDDVPLHEPESYLARFGEATAEGVLAGVREAIRCFLSGRHAATMLLLTAAVEHLVERVADALRAGGTPGGSAEAFEAGLDEAGRDLQQRIAVIADALGEASLPPDLAREVGLHFEDLRALLRWTRDDEGLPTVKSVDRDRAHAVLLTFPAVCEGIGNAVSHIESKTER